MISAELRARNRQIGSDLLGLLMRKRSSIREAVKLCMHLRVCVYGLRCGAEA
jgi:hypothetical protein